MSECPAYGLMPVDAAIDILQQAGRKKTPIIEEVSLLAALGRVLAEDVFSAIDVPHAMPQDSTINILLQAFADLPGIVPSLIALVVLTAGALWLAARTVESREYVLEQ